MGFAGFVSVGIATSQTFSLRRTLQSFSLPASGRLRHRKLLPPCHSQMRVAPGVASRSCSSEESVAPAHRCQRAAPDTLLGFPELEPRKPTACAMFANPYSACPKATGMALKRRAWRAPEGNPTQPAQHKTRPSHAPPAAATRTTHQSALGGSTQPRVNEGENRDPRKYRRPRLT